MKSFVSYFFSKSAKALLLFVSLLFVPASFAADIGPFKISALNVYAAGNMSFRIYGMGPVPGCPGQDWVFVDETDSGSKTKIATLLSAHATGKNVYVSVIPVNFFNNGTLYCQISSITVNG